MIIFVLSLHVCEENMYVPVPWKSPCNDSSVSPPGPASPRLPIPEHFLESPLILWQDYRTLALTPDTRDWLLSSYPGLASTGKVFLRDYFGDLFGWGMQLGH